MAERCNRVQGVRSCIAALLFAAGDIVLSSQSASAATVTRGPYLQVSTPQSISIRWRTDEPTGSVVFFGPAPEFLYGVSGTVEPTTSHEVTLRGLNPNTRYYYSVGSLVESLAQGVDYHFTTSPLPGAKKPTRIWAIGDCGTTGFDYLGYDSRQTQVRDAYFSLSAGRSTDVWLALGDNAYLSGTDKEYQTQFFDIYPALLRNTPLWPTLGNHETYAPQKGGGLAYFDIFTLPKDGEAGGVASGTENYYSFDFGSIHFVSLDSELSYRNGRAPMLSWLQADLAANTNEWLIAYWHSPPYTKGSHDSDNFTGYDGNLLWMREAVVPILESYGVDLVLCGHSHIYERSYLLHGHYGLSTTLDPAMIQDEGSGREEDTGAYRKPDSGEAANQGAVYVVAGSSGWATFRVDPDQHPALFMSELEAGSMVIDIDGERLDARFLRDTGAIDDHFTILKGSRADPFRLTRVQVRNRQIAASWRSKPGILYQLEYTASLEAPDWQPVGEPVTASGATTHLTQPAGEDPVGFYRVTELEAQ